MLVAIIFFLSDERSEDSFEGVPVLDDVAVSAENATKRNVHLVLARDIQLELKLAHLTKDIVGAA